MEKETKLSLFTTIVTAAVVLGFTWMYTAGQGAANTAKTKASASTTIHQAPAQARAQAAEIPVVWGNLGARMADTGVFDKEKLLALYAGRGGLNTEERNLVDGVSNGTLKVNDKNAGLLLNLFWALGLSNQNDILEKGEMTDPLYGGDASRFASTGGWTLAKGSPMDHYSKHRFIVLTPDEQALVERASKNIYRPCCGNSTHFPDCNHGMAMLGLLELMASQGATEEQMYRAALTMNSYWFPEQYATITRYLESRGVSPQNANPKEILGAAYSSGSGFQKIASLVPQVTEERKSGSCGI